MIYVHKTHVEYFRCYNCSLHQTISLCTSLYLRIAWPGQIKFIFLLWFSIIFQQWDALPFLKYIIDIILKYIFFISSRLRTYLDSDVLVTIVICWASNYPSSNGAQYIPGVQISSPVLPAWQLLRIEIHKYEGHSGLKTLLSRQFVNSSFNC